MSRRTLTALAILAALVVPTASFAADDDDAREQTDAPARAISPTPAELREFRLTPEPSFAPEGRSAGFQAAGASMFAASVADIATTEWGLSQGLSEGNPLVRNRGVRIATHVAGPLAVYWATERLRRTGRTKLAFALRLSIMVAYSYAAIHNSRMIASTPGAP